MPGHSISQVSEKTGFSPSTLRFYERCGLVRPNRTPAGYRSYNDRDIEVLAFIGRAKSFGLTLDEITELLSLLDDQQCAPVQKRLRELVGAKIADAQERIADLVAFTAELQRVSATLVRHTPDGPCDETCGCTSDQDQGVAGVAPDAKPEAKSPLICTLEPDRVGDRLDGWQTILAFATSREPTNGGIRIRFPRGWVGVEQLASLAAAEQECCRFFSFVLTLDDHGVALDVTGPPEALPIIGALVGSAA